MAVVNTDVLLERIKSIFGENTSDEVISVVEDYADTIADLKVNSYDKKYVDLEEEYNELKEKYNELDGTWRKKYLERFTNSADVEDYGKEEFEEQEINEKTKFSELFN